MERNFGDRLVTTINKKNSRVVVGLDPRIESLPRAFIRKKRQGVKATIKAIEKFCYEVIDIIKPHAVAVKPQIAFYEVFGSYGISTFEKICANAKDKGLLVIADVKRGDISTTCEAYAEAYLGRRSLFRVDTVTVNPFFGFDGIKPFVDVAKENGKGIFILVKTSNPSSIEFQDLRVENKPIYEILAEKVAEWGKELVGENGYSSIGAVVGATYPEQLRQIRNILLKNFLLIPGYGAQGGKAEDIKYLFDSKGLGAIVNASRSITFAYRNPPFDKKYGERQWEKAVEAAVIQMKEELNGEIP